MTQFEDVGPDDPLELPDEMTNALALLEEARKRIYDHTHQWSAAGIWTPPDRALHPILNPRPYTVVLLRCGECGWIETLELPGVWTLSQVRGEVTGEAADTHE